MRREPQQARAQRTVDGILDAAARLVGDLGVTRTTTNDIAAEAGISIGSLYQYFTDKHEILAQLYCRHVAEAGPVMVAACRAERGIEPRAWTERVVAALVEANETPLHAVLYRHVPPGTADGAVEAVAKAMADEVTRHLRRWGVDRPALRAEVAVVTALALVHEVVIQRPPGSGRRAAQRVVVDAVRATFGDAGAYAGAGAVPR